VARRLAGRPLIVRARASMYKGDLATTHKNLDGVPVIDMPANLQGNLFLKVLLHECAHVKLHAGSFARSDVDRTPQSVTEAKPSKARMAARVRRENEAECLSKKWLDFADRHAVKVLQENSSLGDLEARLWALTKCPKG